MDSRRAATLRLIQRAMADGQELTAREIAAASGVSYPIVRKCIVDNLLDKGVYIVDWHRFVGRGGRESAIYKLGRKKSKPRPAIRPAEWSARYYRKNAAIRNLRQCAIPAGPFDALMPRRQRQHSTGETTACP